MNKKSVLIIGSGIAALGVAQRLCNEYNVTVLTKKNQDDNNSIKAQGGVAASISRTDNWKLHFEDTLRAGCHYNNEQAVKVLVEKGPLYITQLMELGLAFDRDRNGNLQLGKEGAHQQRRILHAGGDATGKAIMKFLKQQVTEKITMIENETVLDLLVEENTCFGAITSNEHDQMKHYYADHVILATGGCGGLYQVSSNNPTVAGDGLALAYRAGAELMDLEFIQFHPTMLYKDNQNFGLVSEAVRGEGAILVNQNGVEIMKTIHPLRDLAPRDIVARAIETEINKGNQVFLDISKVKYFTRKFPTITHLCEQANINIENGSIPIAPGAHFLMGGIITDTAGVTKVNELYAVGEVACTGLHGANRLASNSLLEGITFSNLLADYLLARSNEPKQCHRSVRMARDNQIDPIALPTEKELRILMSSYVGIERTKDGLSYAKRWLEQFEIQHFHKSKMERYSPKQIYMINRLTTCWLIVTSALERTESRGAHFRRDFPLVDCLKWNNKQIIRHNTEMIRQNEMVGMGK